jgi:hypothetical protein
MQPRDRLAAPRCELFERLLDIAEVGIFRNLPANITPAYVQAALACIKELRHELAAAAKANRFHFAAAAGSSHSCVDAAYQQVYYRLIMLSHLHTAPDAPAPPRPQPLSDEDIMANLADLIAQRSQDTIIGEDRETT